MYKWQRFNVHIEEHKTISGLFSLYRDDKDGRLEGFCLGSNCIFITGLIISYYFPNGVAPFWKICLKLVQYYFLTAEYILFLCTFTANNILKKSHTNT